MLQVIVTDTAGLRSTEDAIEAEGVVRARQAATDSNILLTVADASEPDLDDQVAAYVLPAAREIGVRGAGNRLM